MDDCWSIYVCTVGIWVEVRRCEIVIRELSPVLKLY